MMDDLISRQAAIEAIDETDWYHQNENKDMVGGANSAEHQPWFKSDDVYAALKSVPSAQPDIVEKILAAGKEGKEVRIYIGGRLFAVRELAQ